MPRAVVVLGNNLKADGIILEDHGLPFDTLNIRQRLLVLQGLNPDTVAPDISKVVNVAPVQLKFQGLVIQQDLRG